MAEANRPVFCKTVYQGEQLFVPVLLKNSDGTPRDLVAEGLTPQMQIRKTTDSGTLVAQMTMTVVSVDGTNDAVEISYPGSLTGALEGRHVGRLLLAAASQVDDEITPTLYVFIFRQQPTERI